MNIKKAIDIMKYLKPVYVANESFQHSTASLQNQISKYFNKG